VKKGILILVGVLALGLVVTGCKKDSPPPISTVPSALVGKWTTGGAGYEFTADGKVMIVSSGISQAVTASGIKVTGTNTAGEIEVISSLANIYTGDTVDYTISGGGTTLTLSNGSGLLWSGFSSFSGTFTKQ
jgi:hypothetical protein